MTRTGATASLSIATAAILVLGGFALAQARTPDPVDIANEALVSDDAVSVETEPWLTFTPSEPTDTGVIIYPGGRVDPVAYAPAARDLAEAGYLTIIVPMPFGLAVLGADAADGVIEAYPDIAHWAIGGHSLGGAMAARYAAGHDEAIDGLFLWGAYPADDLDLSGADVVVTSIYASEDGLSTLEDIERTAANLPPDTEFVEIDGGNHAQFGWYGPQDGDGEATIDPETQQAEMVAATVALLESI